MEVKAISYSRLNTNLHLQFYKRILEILLSADPTALGLQEAYEALLAAHKAEELKWSPDRRHPLTPLLEASDLRRDRALSFILFIAKGFQFSWKPEEVMHADIIVRSITRHGDDINGMPLEAQSGIVNTILQDFETIAVQTNALTALNLAAAKTELKTANDAAQDLWKQRSDSAAQEDRRTIFELRQVTDKAYKAMVLRLNSQANVNDYAELWVSTINRINEVIDAYNRNLEPAEPSNELGPGDNMLGGPGTDPNG